MPKRPNSIVIVKVSLSSTSVIPYGEIKNNIELTV